MAKLLPQVIPLLLLLQVKITTAGFTVEEPKLPYDLYIRLYAENETGHLSLSNRKLIEQEWDDTVRFDGGTKKANIDVDVRLADKVSEEETAPENLLLLKTAGGHPVLITIRPSLDASENETRFFYEALADSKTPRAELFELLLQTFAKGTHFSFVSIDWLDTFSTSNAMLEAIIATGKQSQIGLIEYGNEYPSQDLITRFVNTVKPSILRFTIGTGHKIREIVGPRLQLPDSFFQSPVVRNLSRIQLEWVDTEISDESLSHLNATSLRVAGAPNLTGQGLLQWLKPVLNGDMRERYLVVSSFRGQALLDGLAPLVDYTEEKKDECWTITGIKNGTKNWPTNLKMTYYNSNLEETMVQLGAKRDYSKDYHKGTPATQSAFVLAILCLSSVFFHSIFL